MKEICPQARIIVTAESIERALKMYAEGADYVFVPRILSARNVMQILDMMLGDRDDEIRTFINNETDELQGRAEIMR
ncbi:MAG TPA: hypothetical protein PK573_09300 [Spirochaetota bacterium]|nr:hypothetical protein [Spirochaetota bacterium]HRZ28413.1 hypothetical protein [Spirochaetota bacterium]